MYVGCSDVYPDGSRVVPNDYLQKQSPGRLKIRSVCLSVVFPDESRLDLILQLLEHYLQNRSSWRHIVWYVDLSAVSPDGSMVVTILQLPEDCPSNRSAWRLQMWYMDLSSHYSQYANTQQWNKNLLNILKTPYK